MVTRSSPNKRIHSMVLVGCLACCAIPSDSARAAGPTVSAERAYEDARKLYYRLKGNSQKRQYRHHWIRAIAKFNAVAQDFPESVFAPRALYTSAELWRDLHKISGVRTDLNRALALYARVDKEHGTSSMADDALWHRARIFETRLDDKEACAREVTRLLQRYPNGDMAPRARTWTKRYPTVVQQTAKAPSARKQTSTVQGRQEGADLAQVTDIKYWSNENYTRVAIYLDKPAEFFTEHLPGGKTRNQPERLYIDLRRAVKANNAIAPTEITDDLLAAFRVAQRDPATTRVVLDLKSPLNRYRSFSMENPYRIVIDAYSKSQGATQQPSPAKNSPTPYRPVVVIDPGHGGKDSGALGPKGLQEKSVVLAISKLLVAELKRNGVEALLTRSTDKFVPLEERTAMANRWNADLFISVHANSHKSPSVRGVETYYLDTTDDHYALRLAALENKTSQERVSDIQLLLTNMSTKLHTENSAQIAKSVQKALVGMNRQVSKKTKDLGVKASLFYVLLGARMPSILLELGFISNKHEALLLNSKRYQRRLAATITEAVTSHLSTHRPQG